MEQGIPLLYNLWPSLQIFVVYWGENWDSIPGNLKRADIDRALQDVIATPYFDKLCQYGVPGVSWKGSTGTGGFLYPCAGTPRSPTTSIELFEFMSCAEQLSLFTGVPLAEGAPNPITCGLPSCVAGGDCFIDPVCLATPNPTGHIVYVVLLPTGTNIDDAVRKTCGDYNAYHLQIPSRGIPTVVGSHGRPINIAIVPTQCFGSLGTLVAGITHEAVEAMIDPTPTAHWIDEDLATRGGGISVANILSLFTDGEAADICQKKNVPTTFFTGTGGASIGVAPYWSNADNACVALDDTPPTTSAALSPAPNADGWNNGDVTVALTAVDSGSPSTGVKEIHFSATGAQPIASTTVAGDGAAITITAEGVTLLTFHAVDNAGNVEADHGQLVRIDRTPPVSSASFAPPPNAAGWNNTGVTVTMTATDPGVSPSGVKEIDYSATGAQPIPPGSVPVASAWIWFAAEGVTTLTFHAVDRAGNAEADHGQPVRIDETPPVITWAGNAGTYTVDQAVAITCTASDALSGVATSTCTDVSGPAWSFGLGDHTVSATATDVAGNVAPAVTATFHVDVTFASLCALGRSFSTRPHVADELCRLLDRGAKARCCEGVEEALEEYREENWEHARKRHPAFTRDQARTLSHLSRALLPAECKDMDDDSHGHGDRDRRAGGDEGDDLHVRLAGSHGDRDRRHGDDHGGACRRERKHDH
jgi:hypothetical protein